MADEVSLHQILLQAFKFALQFRLFTGDGVNEPPPPLLKLQPLLNFLWAQP
jgi:hypothetical protein